jgi:hypothetical protein
MNGSLVKSKLFTYTLYSFVAIAVIYFRLNNLLERAPIFDPYDSQYYFNFSVLNAFRLPVITGVYSLIEDHNRIILFQNIFSSFAWIFFAASATLFVSRALVKALLYVVILGLSTTQLAIFRDAYLMSESLTLSTFLLVSASLIILTHKPNSFLYFVFFLSLALFSGIKSTNTLTVLVIGIIILPFIIFKFIQRELSAAFYLSFFLFLIPFLFFTQASLNSDITAQLNTSAHINSRLWTNLDWRIQVLEANYPPELRTIWKDRYTYNLGETPDQGVANEEIFQTWWADNGNAFLLKFMIRNPDYTLLGPLILPNLNKKTNYSYTLIHGWSQDPYYFSEFFESKNPFELIWPKKRSVAYLFTGFAFIFIALASVLRSGRNYRRSENFLLFFLVFFYGSWGYISWWFGSKPGSDILRHQESPAILFRILAIIAIFVIFDWLVFQGTLRIKKHTHKTGRYRSLSH